LFKGLVVINYFQCDPLSIEQKKMLEKFAYNYLKDFSDDYVSKYGDSYLREALNALARPDERNSEPFLHAKEIIIEETKNSKTKSFAIFSQVVQTRLSKKSLISMKTTKSRYLPPSYFYRKSYPSNWLAKINRLRNSSK